jgi:hypothetical protein
MQTIFYRFLLQQTYIYIYIQTIFFLSRVDYSTKKKKKYIIYLPPCGSPGCGRYAQPLPHPSTGTLDSTIQGSFCSRIGSNMC